MIYPPPESLPDLAVQEAEANARLSAKIKTIPVGELDRIAAPLVEKHTAAIDCTRCGNCCKVQEPGVTKEEIETLAALHQQDIAAFRDDHIAYDAEGTAFLCTQPCIFLDGTICTIYDQRPGSCADFPGLHRPRLKWRWKQVMENYAICPIVYGVVEELKKIMEEGHTMKDAGHGTV